ncbi:MAG: hypothetical protein K2H43_06645 [Clostridia bacterium]|nr:hypothetical protein [Clostridia bacterium]
MRVFFLAEEPCALALNGIHLGCVDGFERACELNPADRIFCELKPNGCLPVFFFFDEKFLLDPPEQIKLYYVRGGVAVYACDFLRADSTLQVLRQERIGNSLLTLCVQGKLQLNLENAGGFHMIPLPAALSDARILPLERGFLLEGSKMFAHISQEGNILVLSEGRIISREGALKAEVPFHDSVGHTAVCAWEDGVLTECTVRTAQQPAPDTFALALFESVLAGADPAPYLADNLLEKADSLKEFLGNFTSVVLTQDRESVGLVYERKPRIYDVRYFRVETNGEKITNIRPE